jgi:hypothetical protein
MAPDTDPHDPDRARPTEWPPAPPWARGVWPPVRTESRGVWPPCAARAASGPAGVRPRAPATAPTPGPRDRGDGRGGRRLGGEHRALAFDSVSGPVGRAALQDWRSHGYVVRYLLMGGGREWTVTYWTRSATDEHALVDQMVAGLVPRPTAG